MVAPLRRRGRTEDSSKPEAPMGGKSSAEPSEQGRSCAGAIRAYLASARPQAKRKPAATRVSDNRDRSKGLDTGVLRCRGQGSVDHCLIPKKLAKQQRLTRGWSKESVVSPNSPHVPTLCGPHPRSVESPLPTRSGLFPAPHWRRVWPACRRCVRRSGECRPLAFFGLSVSLAGRRRVR